MFACPSRCLATRSLRSAAPAAAASFTLAAVFFIVANTATFKTFAPTHGQETRALGARVPYAYRGGGTPTRDNLPYPISP